MSKYGVVCYVWSRAVRGVQVEDKPVCDVCGCCVECGVLYG